MYKVCSLCGANLDFGERCICENEKYTKEIDVDEKVQDNKPQDNKPQEVYVRNGSNNNNNNVVSVLHQLRTLREQLQCM